MAYGIIAAKSAIMKRQGPPKKRNRSKVTKLVAYEAYTDYSDKDVAWVEEQLLHLQLKAAKKSSGGPKVSFPFILYDMLDKVQVDDRSSIVSWLSHGRAFRVHHSKEFETTVLPQYFRQQSSYASFQRQLNIYGFRRLTGSHGQDHNAYYHEFFLRTRKHLCALLTRSNSLTGPVRCTFDASTEPNFYSMTPMPPTSSTNEDSSSIQDSTMCAAERSDDRPLLDSPRFDTSYGGADYRQDNTLDMLPRNSLPNADRSSRRFPPDRHPSDSLTDADSGNTQSSMAQTNWASQGWHIGNDPASILSMRDRSIAQVRPSGLVQAIGAPGTMGSNTRDSMLHMTPSSSTLASGTNPGALEYDNMIQGLLLRPLTSQTSQTVAATPQSCDSQVTSELGSTSTAPRLQQSLTANTTSTDLPNTSRDDIDNDANALVQAGRQSLQRAETATAATTTVSKMTRQEPRFGKMPLLTTATSLAARSDDSFDAARRPSTTLPALSSPIDLFDDQSILSHDGSSVTIMWIN